VTLNTRRKSDAIKQSPSPSSRNFPAMASGQQLSPAATIADWTDLNDRRTSVRPNQATTSIRHMVSLVHLLSR
jgi:hypothetical protein